MSHFANILDKHPGFDIGQLAKRHVYRICDNGGDINGQPIHDVPDDIWNEERLYSAGDLLRVPTRFRRSASEQASRNEEKERNGHGVYGQKTFLDKWLAQSVYRNHKYGAHHRDKRYPIRYFLG